MRGIGRIVYSTIFLFEYLCRRRWEGLTPRSSCFCWMRQGRKKSSKSSSARFRHRSIPYEVENQENATVMGVMGASSVGRSESMSLYYSMGPQREATPLPTLQRCPRRASLVDYMKLPMIVTGSIPVKRVTEPPRLGSAELPLVLPTVMTSKPREPSKSDGRIGLERGRSEPSLLKNASMLLDALFPNNTVYMNGKTRELTQSMRAEMRSILADLLRQTQTHDPSLTCFSRHAFVLRHRSLRHRALLPLRPHRPRVCESGARMSLRVRLRHVESLRADHGNSICGV